MNDIKQRVEETMIQVREVYERTKSGLDKDAWDEFPKFSYVMYSKIGLLEAEIKDLTLREERLVECLWFYANGDNWKGGSPHVYINGEFLPDEGHLARVALNTRKDDLGINPTNGDVT